MAINSNLYAWREVGGEPQIEWAIHSYPRGLNIVNFMESWNGLVIPSTWARFSILKGTLGRLIFETEKKNLEFDQKYAFQDLPSGSSSLTDKYLIWMHGVLLSYSRTTKKTLFFFISILCACIEIKIFLKYLSWKPRRRRLCLPQHWSTD